MYVDDDVHAEQGHAKLHPQLSDQSLYSLGAGRGQVGHLFIQLVERKEVKRRSSENILSLNTVETGFKWQISEEKC